MIERNNYGGDDMNFKELQEIFNNDNIIRFKLYSLEYVIESRNDEVVAYAIDYSGRKESFNSFKEALNNFKIYTEPLMNQIDKIELINKDEQ